MSWMRGNMVRIFHKDGVSAHMEEPINASTWKMRDKCMAMIRGKLWAMRHGAGPRAHVVREYDLIAEPDATEAVLDGKVEI